MEQEEVETSPEAALKSARDANKVLTEYIWRLNEAILTRDALIDFLENNGKFSIPDVRTSDILKASVAKTTNQAYSSSPVRELIPGKYIKLFNPDAAKAVASQTPAPKPQPPPQVPKQPDIPPRDVKAEVFNFPEITLDLQYQQRDTLSSNTTASILSWFNDYLTATINDMQQKQLTTTKRAVGVSRELMLREGFVNNLKHSIRSFADQTNVKIRLTLPDGTNSLIIPTSSLT